MAGLFIIKYIVLRTYAKAKDQKTKIIYGSTEPKNRGNTPQKNENIHTANEGYLNLHGKSSKQ